MMNLGITTLTNPYLWASFGSYAWVSDFGYEMQMNILPSSMPAHMTPFAQGITDPNHVSQWNPMFSIPLQGYNTNPFLTQAGLEAAAKYGENLMAQALDGMTYNENAQKLSAISGQCEGLLKDEKLNDEQKAKLKAVQDKVKALQEQLKEYKTEMQKEGSDKTALRAKLDKITKDVKAIEGEYIELIKTIKSELEALEKGEKVDEDVDGKKDKKVDEKAEEKVEEKAEKEPEAEKKEKADEYSAKYTQSQYKTTKTAQATGVTLAKDLFDAIDGLGTDDEKLDNAMNSIKADNVMEVLDAWNKSHSKKIGNESLLKSIYNDVFWGNDREKYTRILMDALAEKAKAAGVDISSEYNQLNDELKAWWRDDEKIYELINTIHKNLGGKEFKAA